MKQIAYSYTKKRSNLQTKKARNTTITLLLVTSTGIYKSSKNIGKLHLLVENYREKKLSISFTNRMKLNRKSFYG
jgi:hypothetical protein